MSIEPKPGAPTAPSRRTVRMSGAQALVQLLAAEGVQQVFGIASGKLAPLLQALSQQSTMRFVGLRHEASGSIMAAAHFAATGRIAVALGEMGPGGINLMAGAGGAHNNSQAALLITTNQHRAASYPASGMFMDLDTRSAMAAVTKWNCVVHEGARLPELVRTAFRQALSGRPGPVHLDLPQDILSAEFDFDADTFALPPARYRGLFPPRPSADGVQAAAELIAQARRPLIVAGGGVISAGAESALLRLSRTLAAPVITTQMGVGALPSGDPASIGQGGLIAGPVVREAFAQADLVLSLGCRWSSWLWDQEGPLTRGAQRHIAINLDPMALGHPALHDVALCADAHAALQDLLDALAPWQAAPETAAWCQQMRAQRLAYEAGLHALANSPDGPAQAMHPARLAAAIGRALPEDAQVVFDGGHTSFWSNDLTPVWSSRSRYHDPGMCQLGFGLPHALALQLVHPQRPVFAITGDGSFGFTLQELDTARRHGLKVITLIHNNAAWGVIRQGQRGLGFELGTALEDTDYAAIARGFGCFGEVVHEAEAVAEAIGRALASGLPAVIDCRTRFVPHPCMPDFGRMNRYGTRPTP